MLTQVAFMCWHIQKAKCNLIFNYCDINPSQVLIAIFNDVGAFLEANCVSGNQPTTSFVGVDEVISWTSPIFLFIKIIVDASWVSSCGSGFVGIIVQDEEGKFLVA